MEIVLSQFVKSLAESGLMSEGEIEAFINTLPLEKKPDDGAALARELVRQKKLTKFQAQAVYQGKVKALILGDYVVLDRIGQGGMGQVFKAEHKVMKRVVALKTLPASATKSEQAVKRFHREVEVAARLSHPNIVTAHDAGEDHGLHYLVMECVDGDNFASYVREHGRIPVNIALDYIAQAAKGLEYAHKQKVIHRDIKPSNLLLDHEGNVKILDMGLARLNQEIGVEDQTAEETLTGTGQMMGTIDFMPPEQAENTKTADERSDIYSLGCTMFFLLTGRVLYSGDTTVMKIIAHREHSVPSLRAELPEIPEQLDAVYQKMVAKKPEDRYGSMSEVIAELEKCGAPPPEQLAETESFSPVPRIKTAGDEPSIDLNLPVVSPMDDLRRVRPKKPQRGKFGAKAIIVAGAALGLLFVLSLLGVVFMLRTPEGTVVVTVNEAGAELSVDGGKITVKSPGDNEPVEIEVVEGKHTLRVRKGGFQTHTEEFSIRSGGKETVRVLLVPLKATVASKPRPGPGKSSKPGAASKPPPDDVSPDTPATDWTPNPNAPPLAVAPVTPEQAQQHQRAWAEYLGVPLEKTNSMGMKFRLIPPGEYDMGSPESEEGRRDDEGPVHRVRITKPFYVGVYEVTQEEYRQVMGDNPSSFSATGTSSSLVVNSDTGRHPVEKVSWDDAAQFCVSLSALPGEKQVGGFYRLPTEAEWEYACRAGTTTIFHFGDSLSSSQANFDGTEPYAAAEKGARLERSTPVGLHQPNAFGLFDMHGNVWEWCQDRKQSKYYRRSIIDDPPGPRVGSLRVSRGGSWRHGGFCCRSAARGGDPRDYRSWSVGVRVVWVPPPRHWKPQRLAKREVMTNSIGMNLVSIPPGEFVMGSPEAERRVTLGRTVHVGSYYPNKFGLYDMHGNVCEWCADWYGEDYYQTSPTENPGSPPSGKYRILRGSGWMYMPKWARAANRSQGTPDRTSSAVGMRVVCETTGNLPDLDESVSNSIDMTFTLIPAGEFQMGSPESEEDRQTDETQHKVKITRPFYLGVFEITQAEHLKVMGSDPSFFSSNGGGAQLVQGMDTSQFPVEMISWADAVQFCAKLSALPEEEKAGRHYRLPTEAEWEYACRAGTRTPFNHGDSYSSEYANFKGESDEGPQHAVRITKPFYLGMYEVTQEQYRRVMGANPSAHAMGGAREAKVKGLETDHFPVETVSWEDAHRFCLELSAMPEEIRAGRRYRLPTEAEWEYACRADTTTPFHFGISLSSQRANVLGDSPHGYAKEGPTLGRPSEVGSYPANPFGLYDMHGNVWEWCADWYDDEYYPTSPTDSPLGSSSGSSRSQRGGSWSSFPVYCRAANRSNVYPDSQRDNVGFRVVCDTIGAPGGK